MNMLHKWWPPSRPVLASKIREHHRTPHEPEQLPPRVRRYEPGLRYRRWELVDRFVMMLPTWQLLRRTALPPTPALQRVFEIERECSDLCTTHREFELMVKVRLRVEFGL